MTEDQLKELLRTYMYDEDVVTVMSAVRAYLSASNNGKPIVSGALPLTNAQKLNIAWKTLEWVGFRKGEEFENEDVLKMLGGYDR